jgi:hypothetical protein
MGPRPKRSSGRLNLICGCSGALEWPLFIPGAGARPMRPVESIHPKYLMKWPVQEQIETYTSLKIVAKKREANRVFFFFLNTMFLEHFYIHQGGTTCPNAE